MKSQKITILASSIFILFIAVLMLMNFTIVKGQVGANKIYIPLVFTGEVSAQPTPEPTPDQMPGENKQCNTIGGVQICASVNNASPKQNSNVTVYGRLLINGWAQPEKQMFTTWKYMTTTPTCNDGITNFNGVASCTRSIGRASIGYTVNITVTIDGYSATTSFTPID